jgi:hypothetical protein
MIFIVSIRKPKWGRTVPFIMTFNILWDPQQGNSYLFPVPLRIMTLSWHDRYEGLKFFCFCFYFSIKRCLLARIFPFAVCWTFISCIFQRPIVLEIFLLSYEVKFFYFLDILPTFCMVYIQHISTKDQMSWRLCFYEVSSFTFWIYFSFVVWWTWICLYQRLIVLETFVIWYWFCSIPCLCPKKCCNNLFVYLF